MDGLEAFPRGSSGPGGIGGKGTRSSASSKGKRAASSTGTGTTASAAAAAVGAQDDAALLFGRGKRQKVGSSSHASRAGHSSGSAAFKMLEELGADLVTKGGASRPARVVPVTFKRLTRGSELLGVVQRVGPSDVVICLPGGLTGTVVASEISDSLYQAGLASSKGPRQSFTLDSVISAGQVVPCSVLGTTSGSGGKRITLTLRESVVNTGLTVEQLRAGAVVSGRITSVEDHGYLVNLGVPGVTAFLHRRDAGREELSNGQYVLATVKKGAAPGSALALVSSREVLLGICASAKGAFDVSSLKPGMKVEAKVEKVLCNGVLVSFLGFFMGVIDQDHMPCIGGEEEWKAEIGSVGTGLSARILAVNPITKTVHLTLRPHLIQLTAPDLPDEGKTIEGATVVRVDPKVGLLLKLPPSDEAPSDGGARTRSQGAYVHISRISDEHTDKVDKAFVVGHKVSCRIIGSSLVEGWSQAGIRPSLLNAQALKYSDVSPGQLINGVVMRSEGFGLLVSLSGGGGPSVRAVVNNMHLAEVSPPTAAAATRIKSGQRFKVGASIACRVLQVDTKDRRILMTCKPSMVKDKGLHICSYADARKGSVAIGFATKVSHGGVIVTFYDNVHGLVPARALIKHGVEDPVSAFTLGQIVKVVVASSDPTRSPPALILDLAVKGALATREEDDAHISAATDGNQLSADGTSSLIGRIVRGEVAKVLPRGVRVKLPDNGDVFALLPLEHLVDHVAYCRAAAASLVPGAIIPELLVMEESSEGDIAVSQKPLLLSAARADGSADLLPRSISDLTAGNTAVGVVYKVEDFGIFVRFLGGLTALCPRSLVDEQFVANAQGLFSVGDSVRCTIQRVDAAAGRLVVTFKSSATPSHPGALYLETALREGYISAVQPQSDDSGEELGRTLPVLGRAAVGGTCDGVVTAIREYGVILERSDGCVMICLPQHSQAGLQEGDKVKARILELDVEKRLLNVSLDPDVVRFGRRKHKSPPPAAGTTCSAVVLLADAESPHAVASLENGALGYIAIADYHCPTKSVQDVAELVSEGATVSVRVASVMEGGVFDGIALLRIQEPSRQTRRLRSRTLSDVGDDPSAPALPRDEIVIGTVLELPVKSIKADVARLTLQVQEEDGTRVSALARLHITDAPSPSEENVDPLAVPMDMSGLPKWHPFAEISQGDWLSVTVVDVKMKDGRLIVDLSTKQVGEDLGDDMDDDEEEDSAKERLSWESSVIPAAGDVCRGVIASVEDDGCWVHLSPEVKAYVGLLELSSEQEVLARPRDHFAAGMPVLLVIIWVDAQRHHIEARLRLPPAVCAAAKKMPESGRLSLGADGLALPFAEGDVVMGRLDLRRKAPLPPALMINLGTRCSGRVCATEVRDPGEWEDAPLMFQRFGQAEVVRAKILGINGDKIDVSLRPSALAEGKDALALPSLPQEGSIAQGFVVNVGKKGCFVRLSHSITARVFLKELADTFIKDPSQSFPVGKLVAGRILAVDEPKKAVTMSLRPSFVTDPKGRFLVFSNLKKGMKVKGTVASVTAFGVFVKLSNSEIRGMCHKSEAADHNIADLTEAYEPGDLVKAVILKVDEGQRRVSLGLKASYFTGDDAESDESEDEGEGGSSDEEDEGIPRRTVASADENEEEDSDKGDSSEDEEEEEEEEESGAMMNVDDSKESDDDNDNDDDAPSASEESDSDEELDMASPWQEAGKGRSTTPGGSLTVPFDGFDSGPAKHLPSDDGSNSDSDDGEGAEGQSAGHKSRRKASEKRKEEERVARREKALLEGDLEPETAADFDREIMARPNDSFIWLKYMAFQLGLADVEGARAVAERALKTIIFREEQERFNVWNALLNLEHKYGSRSSLEAAVKKASANSHPKKIHLRLCAIYDEAGETEASEEAYERASKKFRSSKQLWMAWQRARLARGDEEGARALLRRSLKSLSEHKHVRVVSSFAMAAFELDCVDAGREVFEGLVASHPKRIDLWNLYVDKEAKMGFVPQARALLERMITLPLSATRIKSVFKKFLKFELRYGSDATQIAVREKAKAYVQSLAA